jgi:predicted HTH domain antitoxin
MAMLIPDEVIAQSGMTEPEFRTEVACRLFGAGKLTLGRATRLAGISRTQFEEACGDRGIAVYRFDVGDLDGEAELRFRELDGGGQSR